MEKIYERLIQVVDLNNLYLHSISSKRYYPDTFQGNVDNSERNLKRLKFEGLGIINGEHISEQIQLRQPNL
jgi:hypothetical protein